MEYVSIPPFKQLRLEPFANLTTLRHKICHLVEIPLSFGEFVGSRSRHGHKTVIGVFMRTFCLMLSYRTNWVNSCLCGNDPLHVESLLLVVDGDCYFFVPQIQHTCGPLGCTCSPFKSSPFFLFECGNPHLKNATPGVMKSVVDCEMLVI